jgi:hypothetical protein
MYSQFVLSSQINFFIASELLQLYIWLHVLGLFNGMALLLAMELRAGAEPGIEYGGRGHV